MVLCSNLSMDPISLSQHHWLSQHYILTFQCMCFMNTSILCLVVLVLGTAYCKPLFSHKRNGQCVALNICGISATESYAFQQNYHSAVSSIWWTISLLHSFPVCCRQSSSTFHVKCSIDAHLWAPCFWNYTVSLRGSQIYVRCMHVHLRARYMKMWS